MTSAYGTRGLGATGVVSENLEASVELARKALSHIGIENREIKKILRNYRQDYNTQIEQGPGPGKTLEKIIKLEDKE